MRRIKDINHVWLFFTDQCNLGCRYCFYKYRTQKQVITNKIFQNILEFIQPVSPVEFIFSGGEPLLEAQRLKEMIATISSRKLERYISVQTNATLLDVSLIKFFLFHRVNIEIGIDGDDETMLSNRPFLDSSTDGPDLKRTVRLIQQKQSSFSTTMVVRPSGASKLYDNFRYLVSMGLKSIEIHPAFLERWDSDSSAIFLKQYRKACLWELRNNLKGVIGREYSEPSKGIWDLLVMPNGKVLGNWLLLSFPEKVRRFLYLMDFSDNSLNEKLRDQAEKYFQSLDDYLRTRPISSYRSISNFNAIYAIKTPFGEKYREKVFNYIDLCQRIEEIDRKIVYGAQKIK